MSDSIGQALKEGGSLAPVRARLVKLLDKGPGCELLWYKIFQEHGATVHQVLAHIHLDKRIGHFDRVRAWTHAKKALARGLR